MVTDVVMPRYSLTMQKGTVAKWLKKEGEAVKKGEPIVQVEADKVTTEVESPVSGVLLKICAEEQTEVPVGEPLAFIGKPGEPLPETWKASEAATVQQKESVGLASPFSARRKPGKVEKVRASPVARRLAKQHGIDLSLIQGTGPKGRITREDVLRFISLHKDVRAVRETIPVRGMQRVIAERMSKSVRTAAHCSLTIEADASRMIVLRQKLNGEAEAGGGIKVSYTDILVKAVATALKEHPVLNSTFEGDRLKIFEDVNIGVAVETVADGTSGLLVPVIRQVQKKSLLEIAKESKGLIERARAGKASHDELTGGTFTITNLGMYGVETFVPIINPPESAILGVGAIIERPVVIEGKVETRPMMRLTLSFDHRVVNGAPAARFMQRLKEILENEL